MAIGFTTVALPLEIHDALRVRKIHDRQPFHEVIAELLERDMRGR